MRLDDYQAAIERFDPNPGPLWYYCLGLGGETGEVLDLVKKSQVNHYWTTKAGEARPLNRDALLLELGDVLWYLARAADAAGFTLSYVAEANIKKLSNRMEAKRASEAAAAG